MSQSNEPLQGKYSLSDKQNQMVSAFLSRKSKTYAEVEAAQRQANQAKAVYEAKLEALDARQSAYNSEVEHQQMFLGYIIQEFELPKPKEGMQWTPREIEPGKYALVTELEAKKEDGTPPTPLADVAPVSYGRHGSKRKKSRAAVQADAQTPLSAPEVPQP